MMQRRIPILKEFLKHSTNINYIFTFTKELFEDNIPKEVANYEKEIPLIE